MLELWNTGMMERSFGRRRSVDGGRWSVSPLLFALSFYLPCVWQAEL